MSDTSIRSRGSSYVEKRKRMRYSHHRSSCCERYWFHITATVLLIVILGTSGVLTFLLYRQAQKDRERRRIQEEFKRKHGVANKILELVSKDGAVMKWFTKNKSSTLAIFKQLITEMVQTIFEQ